jgi:hypothetical protein
MIERSLSHTALRLAAFLAPIPLALACASPGPEVLTSTPDEIAIEFPKNGDLGEATELANAECAKNGRIARFGVVKTAATPKTRVAKYRCIDPNVADTPPPAPAAPMTAAETPVSDTPPVSTPPPAEDSGVTSDAPEAAEPPPAPGAP